MGSFKQVDDATFGKKLEEIIEAAEDDSKALHMLAEIVIEDFHVKKAKNASLEGNKSCNLTGTAEITSYGSEHSKEEKAEEEEEGYRDFKKQRKSNKKMKKSSRKRCFDGDKGKEAGKGGASKKPKREGVDFAKLGFDQAPDLPSELRRKIEEMDGTELELVIMKQLSQTDLSKNHNRISMPVKQIINEFLTMEEKEKLNHRDGKRLKGIDVMVVGPSESDDVTKMCLKKWDMTSSSSYALVSGWYSLVKANKELLKENAIAQFWSFRIKGELWFRLVIARERDQDNVDKALKAVEMVTGLAITEN
ncbi:hypothetical protein GH714_012665 [Hevea brasiliensis]|uniref:TF-B3 domain-containing protein n=1 Tax=Hevea brasiliensis TaxID=3981 RepID=A0A6A6LRY5_HEVBR|nr:hypothetical protein GH714_012665 [Hevea brasiliensis]